MPTDPSRGRRDESNPKRLRLADRQGVTTAISTDGGRSYIGRTTHPPDPSLPPCHPFAGGFDSDFAITE